MTYYMYIRTFHGCCLVVDEANPDSQFDMKKIP